jgi:2-haloacid dehalogenase
MQTSTIDAVVFDLGGVLIDWNPRHLYRKLFEDEAKMERFLTEICSPVWNVTLDAGRSFDDGIAELVRRHLEEAPVIRAWKERWEETERTAFIDDSEKNAEAARRCGFHAIRFTDAQELRGRMVDLGILARVTA